MPARVLIAVGAGVASALIFSLLLTGSPMAIIVTPFTMLPIFLIGLSGGTVQALFAAATATILIGGLGGVMGAATYAAAEAIPALALSSQAIRQRPGQDGQPVWQSPGRLMGLATAYAVFLLVALFIGFSGADGGFVGMLEGEVAASLSPMITEGPEADRLVADLSAQVAKAVPGSISSWWLFITIINLGIAQTLLRRWKQNIRPSLIMLGADTPKWLMVAVGAALLIGLLAGGTAGVAGWNIAIVLAMPYFFVGLTVIHAMSRNWGPGPIFLGGFYIVLLFRGWPALIAVALGFAEQWVKLRDKIGGRTPS